MPRLKHALALALVATTALVPAAAMAREDDDMNPGETVGTVTVFAADGSTSTAPATFGSRAFVDQLVRSGAAGGTFTSEDTYGQERYLTRSGYARPTTARYRRYLVTGTKRQSLAVLSTRQYVNAEGETVQERGWAVDIATGRMRKVSLDAARALSLDPRPGKPGTEYVYQVFARR